MSGRTPFAKEHVMQDYLDDLLRGPDDPAEVTARAARLLEQASEQLEISTEDSDPIPKFEVTEQVQTIIDETAQREIVEETVLETTTDAVIVETQAQVEDIPLQDRLENRFQALLFEVAGLTLAVPLVTLGGIHYLEKTGPLFGKPKWFKGVMLHREKKLNVVDTAQWVMPEKYDQNLAEKLNYQYLIMLDDSLWGLASEKLVNTVALTKDDVKWREHAGKRPWLAGMVKERMCAILDVHQLISLLNQGLGSNDNK